MFNIKISSHRILFLSILFFVDCILFPGCMVNPDGEIMLIRNDRSKYRIVIAENAPPAEIHGAIELQTHLYKMTGAELPIVTDTLPPQKHEIILGRNTHFDGIGLDIDFAALGNEGYVLKTHGDYLVIAGGGERGTMYGIFGLLEDHLDCRWFTPEVSRIPQTNRLDIPALDEAVVPEIEYREPYVWEAFNGGWAARNRMNRNSKSGGLGYRHGGKIEWVPEMFAHTFEKLVPPDEYFRAHPEYFSLVGGRRQRNRSQLCCTNEDVIEIVTEGVLEAFREHPEAYVLSISQNDWGRHCECRKCQTLAEKEGSQIAPVLAMVNRVAEEVEKEFPDKVVETLAYQWTRKAPKNMRPRGNVVIRLCTIECCFSHPLATCGSEENRAFARDLREWGRIAPRLWIWNYNTSFAEYFIPFPNLRVRDDNIRFFVENNVTGVFQQDIYTTPCGELSDLSAYLNAKLLWNPRYDEERAIDEFLAGVYGSAATPIRKYIDLIHDEVEHKHIHIGIWQRTGTEYLSDPVLAASDALWDEAERAVADTPEILERVKTARLSVDYAYITRARAIGAAYKVDHSSSSLSVDQAFTERVDRFCRTAERAGVVRLQEYGYTIDEFLADIEKDIRPQKLAPITPSKNPGTKKGLEYKYYKGSYRNLPNFDALEPRKSGKVDTFSLPFEVAADTLGYVFTGILKVAKSGIYTFYVRSDGYAEMSVGSQTIIKNNGSDNLREQGGFVSLKAGSHPVRLVFYTKKSGDRLTVHYSGPGISMRKIPRAMLSH